jgi:superfamily II DNA helicase RecQ
LKPQPHTNDNHEDLITNLKSFRLQKSREENIKPYYIFNDKQMMDLIDRMPHCKDELQKVSGFGLVKAEKYGDSILHILHKHSAS